MRPRRPGDEELSTVARRRLALIGQELDLLGADAPREEATVRGREGTAIAEAGRHRAVAQARPARWHAWVPDSLRGRVRLAPQHVALVAVVVALALAMTTWWVLSAVGGSEGEDAWAAPAPTAGGLVDDPTAATPPEANPPDDDPDDDPAPTAEPGIVVVHVAGKVRRPGIVTLPLGSRVADAVDAAGGARPRVDLRSVNLARVLVDGEQVLVGVEAAVPPEGAPASPGGATGPSGAAGLVNLNTATAAELETLNGVGPVTAQAILTWREEHGRFTAIEELLEVSGIGEKTLAQLAPQLTL